MRRVVTFPVGRHATLKQNRGVGWGGNFVGGVERRKRRTKNANWFRKQK